MDSIRRRLTVGLSLLLLATVGAQHDPPIDPFHFYRDHLNHISEPVTQVISEIRDRPLSALADIRGVGQWSDVRGRLYFHQPSLGGPVIVRGSIQGLADGLHGLHVHESGNLTNDCLAAGPHFNPFDQNHGDPHFEERHVGDLGNIESVEVDFPVIGAKAQIYIYLIDWVISLSPKSERNIVNRAIVVHEKPDDLGRGTHEDSKKTGNSGKRVACGLIRSTSKS